MGNFDYFIPTADVPPLGRSGYMALLLLVLHVTFDASRLTKYHGRAAKTYCRGEAERAGSCEMISYRPPS